MKLIGFIMKEWKLDFKQIVEAVPVFGRSFKAGNETYVIGQDRKRYPLRMMTPV